MRHHHLSDRDLVLALDGELPTSSQSAVDAHLTACASCRTRRSQLDQAAQVAATLCRRRLPEAEEIAASRDRLRSALSDAARRQEESRMARLVSFVSPTSPWATAALGALAIVLVVGVMRQPESRVFSRTFAPIEHDALPVASLTPGATWNVTADEVCTPGAHEQRQVPDAVRAEVLREYRMERVPATDYELDYLITPQLGGAPAVQNLWPQRYGSRTWNAHVKDQLEQLLPRLVCEGTISLNAAQQALATDWIAAYKKYFHTEVPLLSHVRADRGSIVDSPDDDLVYPVWRSGDSPAITLVSLAGPR